MIGIVACLAVATAVSTSLTRSASHGRWFISCDQKNKCDYTQNKPGHSQRVDGVVTRGTSTFIVVCRICGSESISKDWGVGSFQCLPVLRQLELIQLFT